MYDENLEPLREQEMLELEERALDVRIAAALERGPDLSVSIPADFAARVAAKVPAKRSVAAVRSSNYGRLAMWLGLVVLLVAISSFSSWAGGGSLVVMTVELLLVIQFVAIVAWLSIRQWREV